MVLPEAGRPQINTSRVEDVAMFELYTARYDLGFGGTERRRVMRRRLVSFAAALALVVTLAGCERIQRISDRTFEGGIGCNTPSLSGNGVYTAYSDVGDPSGVHHDQTTTIENVDTGAAKVLGDFRTQATNQSVSANGNIVVFTRQVLLDGGSRHEDRTFVRKRSDGSVTQISPNGSSYSWVVVSDDGTRIAEMGETGGIWVSSVAGGTTGTRTKITPDTGPDDPPYIYPQLSANGRYVTYMRYQGTGAYVQDTVTHTTWSLLSANDQFSFITPPSISDDGRWVAYSKATPGVLAGKFQVYLWDRTTGSSTRVTGSTAEHSGSPSISGDGRRIAIPRYDPQTGQQRILILDRATHEVLATVRGNQPVENPVLSADGHRMIFCSAATDLVAGSPPARNVYLWSDS
jgi:Tol biopolymer transport system component